MASPTTRPARPVGLPKGIAPGGLGGRVLAYVIDVVLFWLVAAGVAAAIWFVSGAVLIVVCAVAALVWVGWAVYLWYRVALRGASPGMTVCHLELIAHRTGRPIGWGKTLVRALIFVVLGATGIGLIAMVIMLILHPLHQGWHDLAVESVMIRARETARRPERSGRAAAPGRSVGGGPSAVGLPPHLLPGGQTPGFAPQSSGPDPRPSGFAPRDAQAPFSAHSASPPPGQFTASARSARSPGSWQPAPAAPVSAAETGTAGPVGPPPTRPHLDSSPDSGESTRLVPRRGGLSSRSPDEGWLIALDDGRQVAVPGLVLLGRDPSPRPGEQVVDLVTVTDNSRTVSKTHLAVGVDNKGVYVMDRGSTNGSAIAASSGKYEPCPPGELVRVREGQIISFGDHRLEIRRSY